MQYKSYGTRKNTPKRMVRKRMRRDVFITNKKMAKIQKKENRLARLVSIGIE